MLFFRLVTLSFPSLHSPSLWTGRCCPPSQTSTYKTLVYWGGGGGRVQSLPRETAAGAFWFWKESTQSHESPSLILGYFRSSLSAQNGSSRDSFTCPPSKRSREEAEKRAQREIKLWLTQRLEERAPRRVAVCGRSLGLESLCSSGLGQCVGVRSLWTQNL